MATPFDLNDFLRLTREKAIAPDAEGDIWQAALFELIEKDASLATLKQGIAALVQMGARLDAHGYDEDGSTALTRASQQGRAKAVVALIQAGANVNIFDWNYSTPVFHASAAGCSRAVQALIGAGANVNTSNKLYLTPLFIAMAYGHAHTADVLMKAGACLDTANYRGTTLDQVTTQPRTRKLLQARSAEGSSPAVALAASGLVAAR